MAGKFAIRKKVAAQTGLDQVFISKDTEPRELPERPAEALTPVCCHLFGDTEGPELQ